MRIVVLVNEEYSQKEMITAFLIMYLWRVETEDFKKLDKV